MARRLIRFARVLGLLFLIYGLGWSTIWKEGAQGDSGLDWLGRQLQPASEARLMMAAGGLLLVASGLSWVIRRVFTGRGFR